MAKAKKKAAQGARIATPAQVESLLFGTATSVELKVKVSDRAGVRSYGFAFDGAPVPMSNAQGTFLAPAGKKKLLEWVMRGDPGGTMKVVVSRDGTTIEERAKSTIEPPFGEGYDAFEIEVA